MQAAKKSMVLLAVAVIGLGAAAWWGRDAFMASDAGGQVTAAASAVGWGMTAQAPSVHRGLPIAAAALTPAQVRQRLFSQGSLADTTPSGEWCVTPEKLLKPCPGLRGRLEYYILGLGEGGIAIGDIRGLIHDEARRAHGDALATDIMAIFDKYWQIRIYDWKNKFLQNDRSTWMPVFEEQRSVRRQFLGQPWADAFYAGDEKHFQAYYAQLESGLPPPPDPGEAVPQMAPGKDPAAVHAERVSRYGEEAAQRLTKVDEEWAQWDRRLAAARNEWSRIQGMNNLSDNQRQEEMQRYVDANFKDTERLRIRALLQLR